MKYTITLLAILWLSLSCSSSKQPINSKNTERASVALTANDIASLDASTEAYLDEQRLSGVVSVIAHRGKIIYRSAQGYADVDAQIPMRENTLFRLASLTKPVTSVAAMILVEQGKLSLNDPISKYLPAFANVKVYVDESTREALEKPITIKNLLMHTAGISSGGLGSTPVDKMVQAHDFSHANGSLEEFIDELSTFPLVHQPGASFTYGYSTDVLARVIEVVSGQKIEDFMKAHIFEPLNMEDTFFSIPENKKSRLGPAYSARSGELEAVIPAGTNTTTFGRGASGLVSTAPDYLRFAQMLLNDGILAGVRILKPETVLLMHTNQLPEELIPLTVLGIPIHNNGFGLGFAVVAGDPAKWTPSPEYNMSTVGNLPATSFYWLGAFNDNFWIDPTHHLVGIVMTQSVDIGKIGVFQDFYQTLYRGIYQPEKSVDVNEREETAISKH